MYTQWYTNPNPNTNANPKVCFRFTLGKYLGREGDLFILFKKRILTAFIEKHWRCVMK